MSASNPLPRRVARRRPRALLLVAAALALGGCTTLDYYTQAIAGQLEIWRAARPIERVIADPGVPAATRERLQLVLDARRFAEDRLGLPADGSYGDYVQLEREFVVWNVFAAPPLSLEPRESCFPLIGCLAYRGYFAHADARRHAASLRADGLDVYVAGVTAYSTLGWFDDPLLSTMLAYDDLRLVEVLFHELAHQRYYLRDDTTFNESFATAVALAGLERWAEARGGDAPAALARIERENALMALVLATREQLAGVYAGSGPRHEKLAAKAAAFAAMLERYAALSAAWQDDGYDRWMYEPWNNAKLVSVSAYHTHVDGFTAMLAARAGDFAAFYADVERLGGLAAAARARCLSAWAEAGAAPRCPGADRAASP